MCKTANITCHAKGNHKVQAWIVPMLPSLFHNSSQCGALREFQEFTPFFHVMNNSKVAVVIIHRIWRVLQKWCSRWSTVACKCFLIVPNSADSLFLLLPFLQNFAVYSVTCVCLSQGVFCLQGTFCGHSMKNVGTLAWWLGILTPTHSLFPFSLFLFPFLHPHPKKQ